MITFVEGDVFTAKSGIIVHGCNAMGVMGSGVAAIVRKKYPDCYNQYHSWCLTASDNNQYIGGEVFYYHTSPDIIIANAITQIQPGAAAEVSLIETALFDVFITAHYTKRAINSVLIGCGIGGLDWVEDVEPVFTFYANQFPTVNCYIWRL